MSILNEIAARTKERIAEEKFKFPLRELISQQNSDLAKHAEEKISFLEALKKPGMSYICEVKKASPSKGLIAPDFPYLDIAKEYEQAGASAISCLTEPFYFQGADRYLQEISQAVNIPVLRKDFTVDEYMLYQAKAFGASAVLLICAILDNSQLKAFGELAQELGLVFPGWILPGISSWLMRASLQLAFPVFLQLMMAISPLQPRTRLRGEFLLIAEPECAVRQLILQVTGSNWQEWMNGQGTQEAETGL